jgi:hypothetical protein
MIRDQWVPLSALPKGQPVKGLIEADILFTCYGCERNTAVDRQRRHICLARGSHRPTGPVRPHAHVRFPVRLCADCLSLVAS